jgi:Holliday junction resolvasome RuvABC endonuclease subunit
MFNIVALDLSLTCTGYAYQANGDQSPIVGTMVPGAKLRGVERLAYLRDAIVELYVDDVDLVLIEDLPHGSRNAAAGALGELHGVVKLSLHARGIVPVLVPPATLKMLATGKGNADKMAMLSAAIQRLGYTGSSGDEVDALWLLVLGQLLVGDSPVQLPATHLRALNKIEWPGAARSLSAVPT